MIEVSRLRMGLYDREVKEILGEEVVKMILDAVESAEITKQKMEDIAQGLGPKVSGGHSRRKESDSTEMRKILSDWYLDELYGMTGGEGVLKLVALFESEDICLKPLALRLRNYLEKNVRLTWTHSTPWNFFLEEGRGRRRKD